MLHDQLPRLDNTFVAWSSGCQLLCPSHSPCTAPARIRNENSHSPFDHHYPAPITPVAPTRHQCSLSSGTSLFLTVLHLCYHSDSIVWLLWYTSVTPALCFTTKICLAHHRKCMHQRYVDACSSCGELSYAFLFHSDSLAGASAFLCKGWLVSINCNWISLRVYLGSLCSLYQTWSILFVIVWKWAGSSDFYWSIQCASFTLFMAPLLSQLHYVW